MFLAKFKANLLLPSLLPPGSFPLFSQEMEMLFCFIFLNNKFRKLDPRLCVCVCERDKGEKGGGGEKEKQGRWRRRKEKRESDRI